MDNQENKSEEAQQEDVLEDANSENLTQNATARGDDLIKELENKVADLNSKYLYAMAELDNTRKRHLKERSDLLKYAGENMARDMLEVLDDLERAASQPETTEGSMILEGINLISNRMRALFERYGIKAEDSIGLQFDPKKHEALTMIPSALEEAGKILQQISKCYYFKDKLLRPAQVIVGSGEVQKNDEVVSDVIGE